MTISLKITTEWKQLNPGFQTSGPSLLSKANTAALRNRNKNYFMDLLWPCACRNKKRAGFLEFPHFPGSTVLPTSLSIRIFLLYFQSKPQPEMRFIQPCSVFPPCKGTGDSNPVKRLRGEPSPHLCCATTLVRGRSATMALVACKECHITAQP